MLTTLLAPRGNLISDNGVLVRRKAYYQMCCTPLHAYRAVLCHIIVNQYLTRKCLYSQRNITMS